MLSLVLLSTVGRFHMYTFWSTSQDKLEMIEILQRQGICNRYKIELSSNLPQELIIVRYISIMH